ncbi:hypothetical protein [Streptomyces griseus]|uniref:Rv1733c family protein n=1 Tax=Streptomyces griseus TaxID=1911 RepID=UPI0005690AE0|nr:hypothetical protein [Streptomyces griseus]
MRSRVHGWRRRPNPLRRRSDVVERWTLLIVAVLLLVGAPLAGAVAGWWAHDEARSVAAQQRADRHRVRAEVIGKIPDTLPSVEGGQENSFRVAVRWTEPGEKARTTKATVPAGTRTGDTVDVWFDARGRTVAPPPGETEVWQHTLAMGACAAGGTVAVILVGHVVVRRVAMRHRMDEWERAWARTEPEWTRRRA